MGPGKFAEIKRIRPPTPCTPNLPAQLPSLIVTPSSNVTPSKGKRSQGKVTNRGDKQKHPNISALPSNKNKQNNKCNQPVMPVIPDKLEASRRSHSSQGDKRCSRYDMRERVFKLTRSSSKPKHENLREINYANLNDGLDDEDVYLPPRKKTNRKGPGSYPSEERLRSHFLQNDHVHKKQKLTNDKEKELDLEKFMDDSDTLPDIVLNRPVPTAANERINHDEPPLNQSSPIASEEEVLDNEELGLTAPLTPNEIAEIAEAAVTAATENIMSSTSAHEMTIPNTNISLATSETDDTNKELSVATANQDANTLLDKSSGTDFRTKVITTMNKENTNDIVKPSSLSLPEGQEQCDNENSVTKQKASTCIVDEAVTSSVTLGQNDTLFGVTEAGNGIP